MQFKKPELLELKSESDVEQKFIYPLLTAEEPSGLGFRPSNIQTKVNLKSLAIGKGSSKKIYYPDYIVAISGVPLLVVEAKGPEIDLDEAFREARLYASELNAIYPTGLNPASRVIATNGVAILAGRTDQSEPTIKLSLDDISPYSEKMTLLRNEFGERAAVAEYARLQPRFRPQKLWKPRRLVGGAATQRDEVPINSFGATISADFSHIFNPINHQDRAAIARDAYVPSKRRERYIEPIDRVIRAATPPSISHSKTLEDTSSPSEIIKAFRSGRKLERQVLLLVGGAGAGKTTFVDYLQEVALPRDVRQKIVWIRINMNPAPISRTEIYDWLRREIIAALIAQFPKIDFDDLETIKSVHAPDVTAFRKGIGRLYQGDSAKYNEKLAERLIQLTDDLHKNSLAMVRYLTVQSGKLLVVVLDNSDKRLRDEQLLMFEAAQWLQREFAALLVLPLREETYDNHRDEPPLDTALKDLVFRIEPPLFQNILVRRIQLALRSLSVKGERVLRYELPNGMYVEYPASEQAYYLSSIMRSIFEHGLHVRRLIVGLSGRNMRRALEIFLEFCTSGHITTAEFLKIRQSKGLYVLPLALVTTVLLRLNQRYYSSSHAYLKSLLHIDEHDARPNYFSRLIILKLLQDRMEVFGPKRLKGYEHVGVLRDELSSYGIESQVFQREIEDLVRGLCVVTEDYRTEGLTDEDLVALAPAGLVHLQMMGDAHYLAAVEEDTWFFNRDLANGISSRIMDEATHFSSSTAIYNASDILDAMSRSRDRERDAIATHRDPAAFERLTDLTRSRSAVEAFERSVSPPQWLGVWKRFPIGSIHPSTVQARKEFGVFVQMEPGIDALIPASKLPNDFGEDSKYIKGKILRVQVVAMDHVGKRFTVVPAA